MIRTYVYVHAHGTHLGDKEVINLAETEDAEHARMQERAQQVRLALELLHLVLVVAYIVLYVHACLCACACARACVRACVRAHVCTSY